MVKKKILIGCTVFLWLIAMGWLLRYEAFPFYFTRTFAGYREMLSSDMLMSDSWMTIFFNDKPAGFSHTSIEVDENDPVFYYTVMNEMELKLGLMGEKHDVDVDTTCKLDIMHQLQEFTFSMTSRPSDTRTKKVNLMTIKAIRRWRDVFSVAIISPHNTVRTRIQIPPDVIIYSPMTEMALKKLRPGQKITIKTLDPSTLSTAYINVTATRKENIEIGDISYDSTLLTTEYRGVEMASWIDEEGAILRQETPFGWTMQKSTPDEALNAVLGEGAQDIISELAVQCTGEITAPREIKRLKLRLTGVFFERSELESFRQRVESISRNEVLLTSFGGDSKQISRGDAEEIRKFLAASSFIQSDHRDIISRAKKITKGKSGDMEKAFAIFEWVNKNISKEFAVTLPSALDVLHTMRGDCNEHTYLFVALARASGLPARIKIGLAFHKGAFYYHAWPAVYAGRWIEMDPTWNQKFVDATHIAFAEGELADQLSIVKLLGQLKIEVLETHPTAE